MLHAGRVKSLHSPTPHGHHLGRREVVLLLHGLASHPFLLWPIARSLTRGGFHAVPLGYRSTLGGIEAHAGWFAAKLRELERDDRVPVFHLVTHSMGSIVARYALQHADFSKLGRIVMLGPPNRGSHVARKLTKWGGFLCKPLRQLSDAPDSFVRNLPWPAAALPIGVIAARHDRVVQLPSTHLPTQRDHVVVPSGHTRMLLRRDVATYVARFLREGQFGSAPQPGSPSREPGGTATNQA